VKHPLDAPSLLRAQADAIGVEISSEQATKILELESALRARGANAGAISARDVPRLRERHILDSLRAAAVVLDGDGAAYDLGSGAGLPGLPIAIARPWIRVVCVERRPRKAGLLEWLIDEVGIANVRAHAGSIEDLTEEVDLCFARALAPLGRAWHLAEPLLRPAGRLVFFAGADAPPLGRIAGARARALPPVGPLLERAGPLVIMSRE
jgi:16S rRNA (guanine527-N7)-methyltransferase